MSDTKQNSQGLMTITNKHVVYAPMNETAFIPNKRWRLNTINSIECDKNSIKFEIEDENIAFEMEKPNKVAKIVKKQKKKMQEKEKKRDSQRGKENMAVMRRRKSVETIVQKVVTNVKPQTRLTRRNSVIEHVDKHSFPMVESRSIVRTDRRTMALPPEPKDSPYCNIRGRQMGRSNTHLEPLSESNGHNTFLRHQSLPPCSDKQSYGASLTPTLEENYSYSSGLSSSEDDFTDLKSMEDIINDRKIKLESLKKRKSSDDEEIEDGDYVEMIKFSSGSGESVDSVEFHDAIYGNITNCGLFANGIGPFESIPILADNYCQYATLDIKEAEDQKKIRSKEETCIYSQVDFVATKALELTRQSLNSF